MLVRFARSLRPVAIAAVLGLFSAASHAATYSLPPPGEDLVGEARTVVAADADTLLDIGRRNGLGYGEMTSANPGVDPWVPGAGKNVLVPTQFILPDAARRGIVLNLAQMRLFYFPAPVPGQPRQVITHPLGIGREYNLTPLGETRVVRKAKNPTWRPTEQIRRERAEAGQELPREIPPGPDNPLGAYALYLALPAYLIHGTNRPWGIGMRVSGGCIRLYPEDIETLFEQVPVGTPVRIINERFVLGRHAGALYLKVLPPLGDDVEPEERDLTPLVRAVLAKARKGEKVDWNAVTRAGHEQRGVPVRVTRPAR
jgi:L,D-transpeptidase ErfK/SrfK